MDTKEFIIIPRFNSMEDGLNYLNSNDIKFIFGVGDKIFDSNSTEIDIPYDSEIINIDNISISINEDPLPGQLYIEDDFLKYYKELDL